MVKISVHKTSFEVAGHFLVVWYITGVSQGTVWEGNEGFCQNSIQKRSCLHFSVFTFNRLVPPDAAQVFGRIPSMQTAFLLIQYSSHIGLLQRYLIGLIWAQNALSFLDWPPY